MLKKCLRRTILYLSSMTGFARENGEIKIDKISFNWFWEAKSVNGKSLDIKTKMPSSIEGALSLLIKNMAAKYFSRGNMSVYLDLKSNNLNAEVKINNELLQALTVKAIELYESYNDKLEKPSATELLALKGVVEVEDHSLNDTEMELLQKVLLESFEKLCIHLQQDRQAEGEKIKIALLDIINKVANIVEKVERIAVMQPEKIKAKLQAQISELLEPSVQISEERLAQEVVLYVSKADIQEEIDRLKAHIKTAKDLLNSGEAVGRRLDFLCQELNREANTTCSKSNEIELTNLGIELKTLIEQFREQVQNIE